MAAAFSPLLQGWRMFACSIFVLKGFARVRRNLCSWAWFHEEPRAARFRPFSPFGPEQGGFPMHAHQMISTHPDVRGHTNDVLIRCIEECYDCAQVCISCADACLAEHMVQELRQCIRLNLDCADICATTGKIATRRTGSNEELTRLMLQAWATACRMRGME